MMRFLRYAVEHERKIRDVFLLEGKIDPLIGKIIQVQALILHAGGVQAGAVTQFDGTDTLAHTLGISHATGGSQLICIADIRIFHVHSPFLFSSLYTAFDSVVNQIK